MWNECVDTNTKLHLSKMYHWCQIDSAIFTLMFRYFLSVRVVTGCFCLPTLFTPVYPFLSHPHMYHAPLPSFSSPRPPVSSPVIFSFFLIPPYLSHFIVSFLLPPHAFICLSHSYPSSLISSVFLSPVMLSSLSSYPFCLISSHFLLILSSISPSVSLVTLLTAYQRQFCLNSVQNVTFKKQATVSAVKPHWVSKLKWKVNIWCGNLITNIYSKSISLYPLLSPAALHSI